MGLVLIAGFATMGGCSTSDEAGTCTTSEACDRGLACSEDGACVIIDCSDSGGCLTDETCLREGTDGSYSGTAAGVCSPKECRSERDCEAGTVCIEGGCYAQGTGPIPCSGRGDCPGGQVCSAGECAAPTGFCSTDDECVSPESCVEGACVGGAACEPACGAG